MNTKQIKFAYASSSEFTLTGSNYTGYYNVDNSNIVREGKYLTDTQQVLAPKLNFFEATR